MARDTDKIAAVNCTLDFLTATTEAKSNSEILSELEKVSKHFGFGCFAVAGIPLPGEKLDPYFLLNGWPQEWLERYLSLDYVHRDPVIYRTKRTDEPFIWSEAFAGKKLDRFARRVMNDAREVRMFDGFSVPVHTLGGFQAIVTFGAEKVDLSPQFRQALYFIAVSAHAKLRSLIDENNALHDLDALKLTGRELEVIRWCSEGKTAWEIAELLRRSVATVRHEITSAQRKLNTVNTTHMVAESFRLGILR